LWGGAARCHRRQLKPVLFPPMPKNAVARQIATVLAAADELHEALIVYKRGLRRFASLIEDGAAVPDALEALEGGVGGKPRLIPNALNALETARTDLRTAIVALAIHQGMSGSELARRLGVSRQLVSRIATQAE
jgi:hypothetical protein